jgi:hypothetical protein
MSFYRRWIVACTAGELIGIGTATGAALTLQAALGEPESTGGRLLTLAAFALVGVVEGGALAALQGRVLRARLPQLRVRDWIGATVAVAVVGWLLGMTPSLFLHHEPQASQAAAAEPGLGLILLIAALAGAAAGLVFGGAQWFVLRRYAERPGRWIWIHMPAWALAMAGIFLGATLPDAHSPGWFIAVTGAAGGVCGGLLLGAVTGLVARELEPIGVAQHT